MYRYVITLGELRKLQKQGNVRLDFLEQFQKTGVIVICCDRGNLSAKVTLRMRKAGYPAYSLAGGYEGYKRFQK